MQAVILAGGMGTRLKPYTDNHPKPMIPIHEKPFIDYLIEQLKGWGFSKVLLLLGYKAEQIQNYFENNISMNMDIQYDVTPLEYDTGARIKHAYEFLEDEFLLMYCDNYCPIDFEKAYANFLQGHSQIQITVYENKDGYTRNNLRYGNGQISCYDKSRKSADLNGVDIGYAFVKKRVLNYLSDDNCNFEASIYPKLVKEGQLGCFPVAHRYYSIGSWERIDLTKEFFKQKKVIFLDRDGTINKRAPKACYIEKEEDFIWLPGAKEAIKLLKDNGFLILLITNQPGIARGRLTMETLEAIHNKMQRDLQEIGTSIDDIFICHHNWDDGCDCRKPKPGMIYEAQRKYSLNLQECILIGDDERDIDAGKAAGVCYNYLLKDDVYLESIVNNIIHNKPIEWV